MATITETLALGSAVGLDPKQLTDVFNSSSARCWSSDAYNPCPGVMEGVPSSSDYKGGFGAHLMLKDLRLGLQMAEGAGRPAHMARLASELYAQVVESHTATTPPLDFSAIYRVIYGGEEPKK
eukprot:gene27546-8803_t